MIVGPRHLESVVDVAFCLVPLERVPVPDDVEAVVRTVFGLVVLERAVVGVDQIAIREGIPLLWESCLVRTLRQAVRARRDPHHSASLVAA